MILCVFELEMLLCLHSLQVFKIIYFIKKKILIFLHVPLEGACVAPVVHKYDSLRTEAVMYSLLKIQLFWNKDER